MQRIFVLLNLILIFLTI